MFQTVEEYHPLNPSWKTSCITTSIKESIIQDNNISMAQYLS